MAPDRPDDGSTTRRRVVRGGVALGVALLGAGFLRPSALLDEGAPEAPPTPSAPSVPSRSLDVLVAELPVSAPPTLAPTAGRAPVAAERSTGELSPSPEPTDDEGTPDEPTDDGPPDRPPSDELPGGGGGGGGDEAPDANVDVPASGDTDLVVDAPPITFADVVPGSRGRTTATASLAGDPADLWLAAAGVDDGENGLTEPERAAGDDDAAGELLAALRVTLTADGATLYDGPLAGLDLAGVRVAGCVTGDLSVTLDWVLPETTGNEVQTDGARVVLRLGATDCGAPTPFAG